MSVSLPDLLSVAHRALDLASALVTARHPTTVKAKGDRDMVSDLDLTVQETVRTFLSAETPDIRFLGEEEQSGLEDDFDSPIWTLDPIDGTANLIRGIPLCGVSLALVANNVPVLGVIDLPFMVRRYSASHGEGAFDNHRQRLQIATTTELHNAIITVGDFAVGVGAEVMNRLQLAIIRRLAPTVQRVRMIGSAAVDFAWLASGKVDVNITLSNKPWDVAAGVVIAQEAGAVVIDLDGSTYSLRSTATLAVIPPLRLALEQLVHSAMGSAV